MKIIRKQQGVLIKKAVFDPLFGEDYSKKAHQRYKIEKIRGDLYDVIADALKWNSLLTGAISEIYSTLPQAQKDAMDPAKKGLIDYAMAKFNSTKTRGDVQLDNEGTGMVDKILDREAEVGKLFQ